MEVKEINDKKTWEDFLLSRKEQANFLQSFNWGECHRISGHKVFRYGFWEKDLLSGIVLLIKQKARRGSYLECPGGPIINWNKPKHFQSFVELIKKVGRKENCIFVRVRPQLLNNPENKLKFSKSSFVKAPMHLHAQDTWVLDITADEETLLKNMRKTTRYLIKKAIKEKVEIVQSESEDDVKVLFDLQKETAKRHEFIPFPLSFFQAHFKAFKGSDQIKIFKAIWQGKVLSSAMIIFYGDRSTYHYSASTSAYPKIPASYLIQWEAIKEAKNRQCAIYDFWGIAPEGSSPKHRFAGVTLFKKGFGGYPISYLPAQDLPLRLNYYLVYLFETLRRVWRRL